MAVDTELEALAARADQAAQESLAARARRLRDFRVVRAYRDLFLDANGKLKPSAVQVIADFSAVARLGTTSNIASTEGELREYSGRRNLALHIIGRLDLDGSRLRDLARNLRGHEE